MYGFIGFNLLEHFSWFNMDQVFHFEEYITDDMPDDTDVGLIFTFSNGSSLAAGFDIANGEDAYNLKYYLEGIFASPPAERVVCANYLMYKKSSCDVNQEGEGVYLSAKEVQEKLRIGRSTLYLWVGEGKFPEPQKFGRRRLWPESQVNGWIAARSEK